MALLAEGLARAEFESYICALSHGGPLAAELTAAGISVTAIGKRWPLDPQAWWQLRRHVRRLRPDVVHAWGGAANVYGYFAARTCGVRCVVLAQRCVAPWKSAAERAMDRYLARRADVVVANGAAVRDSCLTSGLPADKIRVIPNGVNSAPTPSLTRRQMLEKLGVPEQSRLVGWVGPLVPRKRVKDAIWAADLLKVIRDDMHLIVLGDGPHRDRLLRYRDQVEIADKVHFLGACDDLCDWMPHFDVLWSTSGHEGQSNAVLEAMAAGVPVVACDIPGMRELVVDMADGKEDLPATGYLVRLGHRAGFARWTNHLLDHPDLARQLGDAGRQRALGQFSVEAMVAGYASLYREVLSPIAQP